MIDSPFHRGHQPKTALVVFSGNTGIPWLRYLKSGFRHCFVAVDGSGCWVVYNPLCHQTEISLVDGIGLDALEQFFLERGYTVVRTSTRQAETVVAPIGLYSCVEAVKRVLGIHNGWVVTPYQLYAHLTSNRLIRTRF